jgi:hypothetical protein
MSSNTAIGALIIVPILIAASAAYIALKTHSGCQHIVSYCRQVWDEKSPWFRPRTIQRRKQKRSDLASSQIFADSWCDLESLNSISNSPRGYSTFIGQSPRRRSLGEGDERATFFDSPRRIWHPTRSARLMWSFTNPRLPSRSLFELSNVVRPSPVCLPILCLFLLCHFSGSARGL